MSRFGGFRSSADDLAYGEPPQRWDRDRFDRFGRGPPPAPSVAPRQYDEEIRITERDRQGGRREITIDRIDETARRGPTREDERERILRETYGETRPRRRTDRELFGEVDPRELAEMAMTPYRRKSITSRDIDIEIDQRSPPPRPGLLRRQSSLDTFDRKPMARDPYRLPAYTPVPLPIRRREEDIEEIRYRDYEPDSYREVEVKRERSVHRRRGKAKSEAKSVASKASKSVASTRSSSSSSSSSSSETVSKAPSRAASSAPKFKKGKTRMPKRLVHIEAIRDLAYPFDEEEDFYVLRVALVKEEIDEVIKISEMYKAGDNHKVYRYDEQVAASVAAPSVHGEREEIIRKEYINPPSDFAPSGFGGARNTSPSAESSISRRHSPARTAHTAHTARSRGRSMGAGTVFEERRTIIEEPVSHRSHAPSTYLVAPAPPPPPSGPEFFEERKTIIEERAPSTHHGGALIIQERDHRSERDIQAEIRSLELERRHLRSERGDEFQVVEYRRDRSRPRQEVLEIVERERSPPRNVVRVEKDRKGRMALVRSHH